MGGATESSLGREGANLTNDEFIAEWAFRRWGLLGGSRSLGQ
jgi:hypothetical protein